MGQAPERDASQAAHSPLAQEGPPAIPIHGTEGRRQRPTAAPQQNAHDSGQKTQHSDKNTDFRTETTSKVISLGPTVAGTKHDKKAADEAPMCYPTNATLDKDTGFQG